MKINSTLIMKYDPCKSGIDNFNELYPNFDGELAELLALEKIPYSDKIWLAKKVCDIKVLQMWSVVCAESVLPNYEKQFPNDFTIRDCLETVKKVIKGELPLSAAWSAAESARSARSAAESVAWSAAWSAAESAAWSAAWSAAESAARSARSAAESAARSAWSAAESAAWSAESAAGKHQEELNITFLITILLENK